MINNIHDLIYGHKVNKIPGTLYDKFHSVNNIHYIAILIIFIVNVNNIHTTRQH